MSWTNGNVCITASYAVNAISWKAGVRSNCMPTISKASGHIWTSLWKSEAAGFNPLMTWQKKTHPAAFGTQPDAAGCVFWLISLIILIPKSDYIDTEKWLYWYRIVLTPKPGVSTIDGELHLAFWEDDTEEWRWRAMQRRNSENVTSEFAKQSLLFSFSK